MLLNLTWRRQRRDPGNRILAHAAADLVEETARAERGGNVVHYVYVIYLYIMCMLFILLIKRILFILFIM